MRKSYSNLKQILIIGLILTVCSSGVLAQARIVLNGATVKLSQGSYLVVDNSATTAITRNSGHIISEGQTSVIKWNIGTTTGTYTIPWGSGTSTYFPVTFTKSAGTGSGNFIFSTYPTTSQNSDLLPTGITNFNGATGADKSLYAVDRFWQINAQSYTAKPALTNLIFTYLDAEFASPNITTKENALSAQRWNSGTSSWLDFGPVATINTTSNTVTTASVPEADLYSWWSLNYIEDRHWVAAITSTWNSAANWSAVAGGSGGSAVPTTTDAVFFDDVRDAGSNLNVSPSIASLTVANGYSGTISQGANTISISDAATFSGGTFTGGSSGITVTGLFTLSGGAFTSTSGTLDLKNNFVFSSGTFTHNNGTVLFSGGNAQTISGTKTFNNLTIAKASNDVTLSGTGTTTVNGALTLTTRHIITSATHLLALGSAATLSGGSVNSFVSGPMTKIINNGGAFAFPLGNTTSGYYRPATIASTTAIDTWTAQYFSTNPTVAGYTSTNYNNANLQKVSRFEYWNLSRAGSANASVTLSYGTGSYIPPNVGNEVNLRVAHWDGTRWDKPTGSGTPSQSGTNTSGTITMTNVTTFSPYTIGSLDADSFLPAVWLSFTGSKINGGILLNWTTAQEINNDRFEVERSIDGKTFERRSIVEAVGNSSVPQHYEFVDNTVSNQKYYYRIRQVDYDKKSSYSTIISVVSGADISLQEEQPQWVIVPNPVSNSQHVELLKIGQADTSQAIEITLISSSGVVLLKEEGVVDMLNSKLESRFQTVSPGIYILQVVQGLNKHNIRISKY